MTERRSALWAAVSFTLLAVTVACQPAAAPAPDIAAMQEAIEAQNAEFMAAAANGDAVGVAALYTEDAQLLPPGGPEVTGRGAIEAFWAPALTGGAVMLQTMEVLPMTDGAAEVGHFMIHATDGAMLDEGHYIVLWQQDAAGVWRLHRDIWTSTMPPSPAPSSEAPVE